MPFRSQAQRRWMYSQEPEMARRWEKHTSGKLPERVGKMKHIIGKQAGTAPHPHEVRKEAEIASTESSSAEGTWNQMMRRGGVAAGQSPEPMHGKFFIGKLKLATPAGPVTAPSDRAGVRGKMEAVNGEGLVGKMALPTKQEASYLSAEDRFDARPEIRCGQCSHFTAPSHCDAIQGSVEQHGYCVLFRNKDFVAEKSLLVRPRQRIDIRNLEKGMSRFAQVTPQGSAPRQETPPMPDFQGIYFQPETQESKKREREQQETRRRSMAYRNKGRFGFHGEAMHLKPELRYETDEFLNNTITEPRPGNKKPKLIAPKLMGRLRPDGKMDTKGSKKKRKRVRLVVKRG